VSSPIWGSWTDIYFSLKVTVLFFWSALSDERTGLSFLHAAGPLQRNHFRVRVPWDSRPYFTVSDLRLPFSSPPTTRGVTLEVFNPASTRPTPPSPTTPCYITPLHGPSRKHRFQGFLFCCMHIRCRGNMFTEQFLATVASSCLLKFVA
jgi:hypothetical protein